MNLVYKKTQFAMWNLHMKKKQCFRDFEQGFFCTIREMFNSYRIAN